MKRSAAWSPVPDNTVIALRPLVPVSVRTITDAYGRDLIVPCNLIHNVVARIERG